MARNNEIFSGLKLSFQEVFHRAIVGAKAWQSAQEHLGKPRQSTLPSLTLAQQNSGFNCFRHVAWNPITHCCGLGWVIYSNSDPSLSHSGSLTRSFMPSDLVAEAMAILAALSSALENECHDLQVRSDNATLVHLLRSGESHTEVFFILCDIRALLPLFNSFATWLIPRLENVLADILAKEGLRALTIWFFWWIKRSWPKKYIHK